MTVQDYGLVISAFSLDDAYLGNPVQGRPIDRYGVRAARRRPRSSGPAHRPATPSRPASRARGRPVRPGFGEGANFPAGLRTATQTLPPERRPRGLAVAYSGGSLGAVVHAFLNQTPVARKWGWRAAFIGTGHPRRRVDRLVGARGEETRSSARAPRRRRTERDAPELARSLRGILRPPTRSAPCPSASCSTSADPAPSRRSSGCPSPPACIGALAAPSRNADVQRHVRLGSSSSISLRK